MTLNPAQFRREHQAAIAEVKAKDPTKYWSVSSPGMRYRSLPVRGQVSGGEQSGFVAVKKGADSVDVGGLVGLPGSKGVTKSAFAKVDQTYPEHPQTLDAFDEQARSGNINLPKLYGKHGFTETGRVPFDPQYAPPEWNPAVHGRPDVVFMSRPAAQGSLFPKEYPTTPPREKTPRLHLSPGQFKGQQTLPGL